MQTPQLLQPPFSVYQLLQSLKIRRIHLRRFLFDAVVHDFGKGLSERLVPFLRRLHRQIRVKEGRGLSLLFRILKGA